MPNGERLVLGGQVIIEKIGREDGGEYQCWDVTDNTTITTKHVNVLCKLLEMINGQNTWSNIICASIAYPEYRMLQHFHLVPSPVVVRRVKYC